MPERAAPRRPAAVLVGLLLTALVIHGAVSLVFPWLQRTLLYFPTRHAPSEEQRRATALGATRLPSVAGDTLGHRFADPRGAAEAILVVAHGNAGSALDRTYFATLAWSQARRFEVRLVEYPGYGARSGQPDERGNVAAVVEAIDQAKAAERPIVLFGESLGSAVVALAAAERRTDVAALVLVTPLPRLSLVAAHHYPFLPTALLADRYEADAAIARYGGPVAFVVAAHDEIIPPESALAMHRAYPHEKLLVVDPQATHNGLDYAGDAPTWRRVFTWLEPIVGHAAAAPPD